MVELKLTLPQQRTYIHEHHSSNYRSIELTLQVVVILQSLIPQCASTTSLNTRKTSQQHDCKLQCLVFGRI